MSDEESDYTDSEEELDYVGFLSRYRFPEIQTVNERYFDSDSTKRVLQDFYGEMYVTSHVIRYCYFKYPMLLSTEPLEEPDLSTIQRQLQLQGSAEYCMVYLFNTFFVNKICLSGCFPLGNEIEGVENLLIKLHQRRCVMVNIGQKLHVSRNVRKKSKNYVLTVNGAYERCVNGIDSYHSNSWLFPRLRECFAELNQTTEYETKVFSFELWNISEREQIPATIEELVSTCPLVAGEIGYACGGSYTSLTGYHTENCSGSVQLAATGRLLDSLGYKIWDFGMSMTYKLKLGAEAIQREQFLPIYRDAVQHNPSPMPQQVIYHASHLLQAKNTQ